MATYDEKVEWLVRAGLVTNRDGEVYLSHRAVALLTGVPDSAVRVAARNRDENGVVTIPSAFARDMRRGAAEVRAAVGSDDLVDVLYTRAVAS